MLKFCPPGEFIGMETTSCCSEFRLFIPTRSTCPFVVSRRSSRSIGMKAGGGWRECNENRKGGETAEG